MPGQQRVVGREPHAQICALGRQTSSSSCGIKHGRLNTRPHPCCRNLPPKCELRQRGRHEMFCEGVGEVARKVTQKERKRSPRAQA